MDDEETKAAIERDAEAVAQLILDIYLNKKRSGDINGLN